MFEYEIKSTSFSEENCLFPQGGVSNFIVGGVCLELWLLKQTLGGSAKETQIFLSVVN